MSLNENKCEGAIGGPIGINLTEKRTANITEYALKKARQWKRIFSANQPVNTGIKTKKRLVKIERVQKQIGKVIETKK